ncbi:unnamed protein product, partial [Adineta steineri]
MNILQKLLTKKYNQLKKVPKTSSTIVTTNNSTNLSNGSSDTSIHSASSSNINLNNEKPIKLYLIQSVNDWCKKLNENEHRNQPVLHLEEHIDYEIIIDINLNKVLIKCECGATSTLGRKENTYI